MSFDQDNRLGNSWVRGEWQHVEYRYEESSGPDSDETPLTDPAEVIPPGVMENGVFTPTEVNLTTAGGLFAQDGSDKNRSGHHPNCIHYPRNDYGLPVSSDTPYPTFDNPCPDCSFPFDTGSLDIGSFDFGSFDFGSSDTGPSDIEFYNPVTPPLPDDRAPIHSSGQAVSLPIPPPREQRSRNPSPEADAEAYVDPPRNRFGAPGTSSRFAARRPATPYPTGSPPSGSSPPANATTGQVSVTASRRISNPIIPIYNYDGADDVADGSQSDGSAGSLG